MKLNWLQKIFFSVNIMFALGLLLANFSSNYEPNTQTLGYLLGLSYPYFLGVNLLFAFFWMYLRKVHFVLSLLVIGIGYSTVSNLVAFNWSSTHKVTSDFSVMSFNVRLFNQYHWLEETTTRDQIFNYVEKSNPDIICFQEFFDSKKAEAENIKRMKSLGYSYFKKEPNTRTGKKESFFGLILFSKFKIVESGIAYRRENKKKSISYYTDVKINDNIIRFYNTHLNSLGFIPEDYSFVENITNTTEEEAIRKSKSIISKVMVAARKRQNEVAGIISHINKCEYPVIVLGDFNEPPYSYAYPQFVANLQDPFLKFGFGLGTTFDGISTLPGLRLDYILHSNQLESNSYNVGPKNLSDHRPIIVKFQIKE